jgi:hypothetical protein
VRYVNAIEEVNRIRRRNTVAADLELVIGVVWKQYLHNKETEI